jgi:hypothetical protein
LREGRDSGTKQGDKLLSRLRGTAMGRKVVLW